MSPHLRFRAGDAGEQQVAAGLHQHGSLDGWLETIELLRDYPVGASMIYLSLCATMLRPAGIPNFGADLAGETSKGKTTTLRVGASCYGQPDEAADDGLIFSWDVTPVFVGRLASLCHDIPIFLDDSSLARFPNEIERIIYMFANGRDRGRGSRDGLRRTGAIRTILLSTGEQPLAQFTKAGGTESRIIPLWGVPFESNTEDTSALVAQLTAGTLMNYGHAGPLLAQYLADRFHQWDDLRKRYADLGLIWSKRSGGNTILGRRARFFAALDLTAQVVHAAIPGMPWDYDHAISVIEAIWQMSAREDQPDRAREALQYIYGWAVANSTQFDGGFDGSTPYSGLAGRWDLKTGWRYIAFFKHKAESVLTEAGYQSQSILRQWKDRGWLQLDNDGTHLRRIRIGSGNPRAIVITREALTEAGVINDHDMPDDEERDLTGQMPYPPDKF